MAEVSIEAPEQQSGLLKQGKPSKRRLGLLTTMSLFAWVLLVLGASSVLPGALAGRFDFLMFETIMWGLVTAGVSYLTIGEWRDRLRKG